MGKFNLAFLWLSYLAIITLVLITVPLYLEKQAQVAEQQEVTTVITKWSCPEFNILIPGKGILVQSACAYI